MPDILCYQCSIFRNYNICYFLSILFTTHLEESLSMIFFHIQCIPCSSVSLCFISFRIFSNMLIFHIKHLFQLAGTNFSLRHINEAIQNCRMTAHNIVSVQIHSPTDVFWNFNTFRPLLIKIRKSSIIGKLFQCICQNKSNTFFSIFFNHSYCSIRVQAHTIKVI